jgi:cbb3-type cytochrome oxidase maturation protein
VYYLGWMALVMLSLWVSLIAFFWAIQNGQFADQGRARYLPLTGEPMRPQPRNGSKWPVEVYVLCLIGCITLVGLAAAILLSMGGLKV